jgi:DNA modification methylase
MLAMANAAHLPIRNGVTQTVVTSPPYWGLRDYGLPPLVWGGDAACVHAWGEEIERQRKSGGTGKTTLSNDGRPYELMLKAQQSAVDRASFDVSGGAFCRHCSAWRGCLGLEPTPELYVDHLVTVFREVRRVLRDDGTLWLNLGDSYATSVRGEGGTERGLHADRRTRYDLNQHFAPLHVRHGLKPKDLVGIPWRVAFALQADGWYLRADIIWAKPNPMPESVTDRPTKAHEYLFLLAKSERYYYDAEAIKEPDAGTDHARAILDGQPSLEPSNGLKSAHRGIRTLEGRNGAGRNRRSVWIIATQPYPEAHFATFPLELVRPCILAGSPVGGLVMDPFCGTATVGEACASLGRRFLGLDLSATYLGSMARDRIAQRGLML